MAMKRRIWSLRIRLHDWMWDKGTAREAPVLRRACRKLPAYLSDPYYMTPEQIARAAPINTSTMGANLTFHHNTFRSPEDG